MGGGTYVYVPVMCESQKNSRTFFRVYERQNTTFSKSSVVRTYESAQLSLATVRIFGQCVGKHVKNGVIRDC